MWLSIRLPQLPLESVTFNQASVANLKKAPPMAVIEDNLVHCINKQASDQGVKVGQTMTGAFALCDQLQIIERNEFQETQRLQSLAMHLYEISSSIQVQPAILHRKWRNQDALIVMEIARSLKLYQGVESIVITVSKKLKSESVSFLLGIGHNEKSANLLSYLGIKKSITLIKDVDSANAFIDIDKMNQMISNLPVELMEVNDKVIEKIQSIGLETIKDLNCLPESKVSKRFGTDTSRYLQRLFNRISSPIDFFIPPENFHQKMEFMDVIHHRQGLKYPIIKLTELLTCFLRLKQKNCQSLYWELFDSEKNIIGFEVLVSESQINTQSYIELTQLNLERYTLHAPIEAIALTANKLNNLSSQSKTLFEQSGNFKEDKHFINKIRAKLGNDSCYQVYQQAEHVPELASTYSYQINEPVSKANNIQELHTSSYTNAALALDINQQPVRPAWLLEKPKPIRYNQRKLLWNGELQIISAQEKITNYWWKKNIARDYFLAEHEDGTIYWVFYDQVKKQWFLHGVYG